MGTELATCGAAVPLWKFFKEDPIYGKSEWKCELQFSEGEQKGTFPSENALLKLLYLRVSELYKKWEKIYHRLQALKAVDQEQEAEILQKAYECLICAYQEFRALNDEMEILPWLHSESCYFPK